MTDLRVLLAEWRAWRADPLADGGYEVETAMLAPIASHAEDLLDRLDALEKVAEAARDVDEMWSGEDGEVIQWDPETSLALEDLRTALSGADRLDTETT